MGNKRGRDLPIDEGELSSRSQSFYYNDDGKIKWRKIERLNRSQVQTLINLFDQSIRLAVSVGEQPLIVGNYITFPDDDSNHSHANIYIAKVKKNQH